VSAPALKRAIFRKHWERIKRIDFPDGPLCSAGVHRPHSHHELRLMAWEATRNELRRMRATPVNFYRMK
jgi:hypothetical protein